MLHFRRVLAAVCYMLMLAADSAAVYVIYLSVMGGMTYHLGMLIFIPLFIFTYWMSTFFSQLTSGRVVINGKKRRIMPKWARTFLNGLGNIVSLALLAFWGYIYITQALFAPAENASLMSILYLK